MHLWVLSSKFCCKSIIKDERIPPHILLGKWDNPHSCNIPNDKVIIALTMNPIFFFVLKTYIVDSLLLRFEKIHLELLLFADSLSEILLWPACSQSPCNNCEVFSTLIFSLPLWVGNEIFWIRNYVHWNPKWIQG